MGTPRRSSPRRSGPHLSPTTKLALSRPAAHNMMNMDMNNPMFWMLMNNNNGNNDNLMWLMMMQQNPNFMNDPNNPLGSFLFADAITNDDDDDSDNKSMDLMMMMALMGGNTGGVNGMNPMMYALSADNEDMDSKDMMMYMMMMNGNQNPLTTMLMFDMIKEDEEQDAGR